MLESKGKATKRNLVLIDNLVLDLGDYGLFHPGGKFVLQANIGRDISKFFYGGYSMINSPGQDNSHRHSQTALQIAKRMVIGVLESQTSVTTQEMRIVAKNAVNATTYSFCFESTTKTKLESFKLWSKDLSLIGKHNLVSASSQPNKMRHYTICNTYVPSFYEAINNAIDAALSGDKPSFDETLLNEGDSTQIWLTVKNYEKPLGVSTAVYNSIANT